MYLIRKKLAAKHDWCILTPPLSVDRVSVRAHDYAWSLMPVGIGLFLFS